MLRAIIADTGPLYSAVDPSDQYHLRAQNELDLINQGKWVTLIPYPIYLEAHKLIRFRTGFDTAFHFSKNVAAQDNLINPTNDDYQAAIQWIARFSDQKITLFDSIVAVLATQARCPVWTYDYHFDVMQIPIWR
ncbi:MAG: hypothetical protein F6K19_48575 [Cyanothece sp. SIO1E1]|nr:hypothetical protein [Cyanothece sp. SIO1E1]